MSKRFGRRVAAAVGLMASAALLLAGCAGGGSAGGGGDRIKIAMMQPPTAALNPFSDDVAKLSRWSTGETLVRLNDKIEIEPLLATEWKQVDDLTWVFTLRDDVTFHDGTPFNAAAVKNTLDKAVSATTPPRALNGVKISTEATGEYEVTITTDTPDPLLTNRLASPQLSIFSEAAYRDDGTISPIGTGTGPFELTDVNGTTTATLERYDGYWGEKAKAAGIDVDFVPDGTARAGAIRSGEADGAESIPVSQVTLLDPQQVNEVFMPRTTFLTLNSESGPFADPAVRAAARAAIDPKGIVDTVYEGQADPADGLLGPALPWAEKLRGNIESATEPAKVDGVPITLATYSDRAENPEIAVQLQKQLEEAGFVVTQDVREYVNMEEEMLGGGFDAVIISRNILLDTGDPLSFFSQDFTCSGGFNVAQLCDAGVDGIVQKGLQATGDARQQAAMDAEAAILRLDSVVPLVHERVVQAEAGTFTNVVRDPLERRLITEQTAPAG
ncbi:ABC transporter substrate-binding protein [Leucobacter sp. wl10]|uniref:ABC transporter substrate-binding protein n=1 Tax=Leucobacter sp. wl10 TaxID=2304677 RepID=UPI000E5BE723|nr:ABC transporter substrate-binding protein [Leucobacter sp. wl10]RGE20684.1 ABC transporter substrate-binding protein [Leucobacter sp. wl10]